MHTEETRVGLNSMKLQTPLKGDRYLFKRLVVMAIFCVGVFSACKQEIDPQKKITVTDIPAEHNGSFAVIALIDTDYPIAENRVPATINNGIANINLVDLSADGFPPFTESGIFKVLFWIRDSMGETTYFSGVIDSKPITDETTIIRFSEFRNASLSVRQTPLRGL